MKYFLSILFLSSFYLGQSQQTGAFSLTISFDEPDYDLENELAFYVPMDYDENHSYPLIVGFRGGPHSGPGHLRDQLQPLSDSLNAIIMCPESVALWSEGQEELVKSLYNYSVDTTASLYNIDLEKIYITGLSFGGRHTILASLDSDTGPIPAGIRGIIPFGAGTNSENVADYDNVGAFPICTCIGQDDLSFFNVSYIFHLNATAAGGTTLFNEIPGVGHTMDFPTFIEEMMECYDFIEAQYPVSIDEYSDFEFELYPNPVSDMLQVTLAPGYSYRAEIRDTQGRLIKSMFLGITDSMGSLEVSDLARSSYLLTLIKQSSGGVSAVQEAQGERSSQWFTKD